MSRNNFTTLLWDVDNTLLDFDYSQRASLEQCLRSVGVVMTEEILADYAGINDRFWKRLERGEVTREELLPGRFVELFAHLGIQGVDPDVFHGQYEEGLGHIFRFRENALDLCRSLRGRVRQYLVTNGTVRVQRTKLGISGLDRIVDGVFISQEVGADKPQKAYFDYCLAHIPEKNRERILIVGDSLTSDMAGGTAAGIPVCWYNPKGLALPADVTVDYEIGRLDQVLEILG